MFYAIFISMIVVYGFLAIYKGLKSGCWPIVLMLVILFVYKSCEQYEEDWGENGRFAPKSETYISTQERTIKYPEGSPKSRYWRRGYDTGYSDGEVDWALDRPYFSYRFDEVLFGEESEEWDDGYFAGYSYSCPGTHRLTKEEIDSICKEYKE